MYKSVLKSIYKKTLSLKVEPDTSRKFQFRVKTEPKSFF